MSTVRFAEDGALGVVTLDSPPLNLIGEALIGEDVRRGIETFLATGAATASYQGH
jgi:hypothetical protein